VDRGGEAWRQRQRSALRSDILSVLIEPCVLGWGDEDPTSVNAENVIIDHYAQREIVEHIREVMPDIGVPVFPTAFRVEPIALRDTSTLVIPSDKMHARRIPQLEAHQQGDRLDRKQSSIDVVTQEEVIRVRTEPSNLEDLEHVEELAVDVADNGDGREDVHHVRLVHELFLQLVAYRLNHRFRE